MDVSIIVAASENGVIGRNGQIPWRLPSEQALFKKITMGHPMIMGRKTHEAIGRALPGRTNIVVTSQPDYSAEGCSVVNSIDDALELAKKARGSDEIFIIGGSEIYNQVMPKVSKIYLTRVHTKVDGDTFFKLNESQWQQISKEEYKADVENPYDYDFLVLERKK